MALEWYSISPYLDEAGAFEAFRTLPDAAALKPVPVPDDRRVFNSTQVLSDDRDSRVAGSLGFTGVASFEAAVRTRVLVQDFAYWTRVDALRDPIGGKIYGTVWGAGIRLVVRITDMSAKFQATLPCVAAATELGLVRSSYDVVALGFAAPDFMQNLPGPRRFDTESWSAIRELGGKFIKTYASGVTPNRRGELRPVPLRVRLDAPPVPAPLAEAKHYIQAVRLLGKRSTLDDAIQQGAAKGVPEKTVREVYLRVSGIDDGADRMPWLSGVADKWLDP